MPDTIREGFWTQIEQREEFSEQVEQKIDAILDDALVSVDSVNYSTNRITVDMDLSEVGAELNEHGDFDGLQVITRRGGQISITESTISDGGQEMGIRGRGARWVTDQIGQFLIWDLFSTGEVTRPSKDSTDRSEIDTLKAERTFLDQFWNSTVKWGGLGIVLPLVLVVLDIFLCGIVPNGTFGILMEVIGALALASGILIDPMTMRRVSTSGWGGPSPAHRRSLAIDAADGSWGIFLVVSGTIWQSLAVSGFVLFSGCI